MIIKTHQDIKMKRYKHNIIHTDKDGNRYRESTLYPGSIPRHPDDIYIYIKSGQRLDLLADKYYNDTTLWWIIALANNIGKGTLSVPPGVRLRIPSKTNDYIEKMR
tara:strand:+ start:1315 stop:1632 length:318 start_codon:yes stop_codon:yes gene_type:complete